MGAIGHGDPQRPAGRTARATTGGRCRRHRRLPAHPAVRQPFPPQLRDAVHRRVPARRLGRSLPLARPNLGAFTGPCQGRERQLRPRRRRAGRRPVRGLTSRRPGAAEVLDTISPTWPRRGDPLRDSASSEPPPAGRLCKRRSGHLPHRRSATRGRVFRPSGRFRGQSAAGKGWPEVPPRLRMARFPGRGRAAQAAVRNPVVRLSLNAPLRGGR